MREEKQHEQDFEEYVIMKRKLEKKLKELKNEKKSEILVRDVDEENFDELVIEKSKQKPVLVDFWASWCMPCRILSPTLERLVNKHKGKFLLAKVNVDENQNLAMQYDIMSIPTVILFKNGKAVDYFVGALPEEEIGEWLKRNEVI